MGFNDFYLFLMCPPVLIVGIAMIVYTIGVAGLVGIGVRLFNFNQ
jgi:hypothetical protein